MEVAEDQTEVMKKSETLEETETLPLVDEEHGSRTIKERKQQKMRQYVSRACLIVSLLSLISFVAQFCTNPDSIQQMISHSSLLGLSFTLFLALFWAISSDLNDKESPIYDIFIESKHEVWIRRFGTICLIVCLFIIAGEVKYALINYKTYQVDELLRVESLLCLILLAIWCIIHKIYGKRTCSRCCKGLGNSAMTTQTKSQYEKNLTENWKTLLHI